MDLGIIVDKSKATIDYSEKYEQTTGKPYMLPFPPGSSLNEPSIKMAKIKHEEYKKQLNIK
jgi:hypothetical protein